MSQVSFTEITGEEPVWVVNRSSGNNRGPVMFGVVEKDTANMIMITVPDTFLPINLVELADSTQLKSSHNLREAVESGLLRLVKSDEAKRLLSMPGAKKELRRLGSYNLVQEATTTKRMAEVEVGDEFDQVLPEEHREAIAKQEAKEGGKQKRFHKRVERVAATIANEDEVDLINMLRAILDELKIRDLKQIGNIAQRHGKKRMYKWARSRIRQRSGKTAKKAA